MIFWSMGGGKQSSVAAQSANNAKGINTKIPDAHIKENKGTDKLSIYQQADKDSLLLAQQMQNDPYYKDVPAAEKLLAKQVREPAHTGLTEQKTTVAVNEEKVNEKLQQLQSIIHQSSKEIPFTAALSNEPTFNNAAIDRLEKMMQNIKQGGGEDKEMQQLNGVMDKLLDLQHPERVSEKLKEQTQKNGEPKIAISLRDSAIREPGFYGMDEPENKPVNDGMIEAMIAETQTLVSGATVKIILNTDIYINKILIPRNSFVYGIATLSNERLKIHIATVRYQNSILPVLLEGYDLDGQEGIYIPGSISRDIGKQSSGDAINSIGITSLDPSLAGQATGAGIQAAKTLMTRKIKQIKVTVREGYRILLKTNNQSL
jgi:conjugative transposon TraM protein